jgi:DUF1707 SHOCT-like domain
MAGASDRTAMAGGHLLASDADRAQVIGTLQAAFARGVLTQDEFGARAARTSGSRTYAELAMLTADIPARRPANIETALWGVGVFAALPPAMFVLAYLVDNEKMAAIAVLLFLADFVLAVVAGAVALGTAIDTHLKNRCSSGG